MSRIYFHTPTETVEVFGSERAWLGELCRSLAGGAFRMLSWQERLALLPADHYVRTKPELGIANAVDLAFDQYLGGFMATNFADGTEVFAAVLNTVLRLGSAPMQLAARIHGQCEIHGYVEPRDGEFIAALIEQGLRDGVFREFLPFDGQPTDRKAGWEEVCRVLRTGEIVVTSYSVCEQFPNASVAAWEPPICEACGGDGKPNPRMKYTDVEYDYCTSCGGEAKLWDAWYDLADAERWRLGVQGVRGSAQGLRWGQENWQSFYFGHGRSALDYQRKTTVA